MLEDVDLLLLEPDKFIDRIRSIEINLRRKRDSGHIHNRLLSKEKQRTYSQYSIKKGRRMRRKNSFICSRCGSKVTGKPVRIAFFLDDGGELTDTGLPEDMLRSIEEGYCGVCAVRIRQAMKRNIAQELPEIPALKPGRSKAAAIRRTETKFISMRKAAETSRRILKLYREGAGVQEIADDTGFMPQTVKRHLRELKEDGKLPKEPRKLQGTEPRRRKDGCRIFTDEDEDRMCNLWQNGMTYAMIGMKFGVSEGVVGYHIRRRYMKKRREQKSGP
jgi:DNA-binding CsgD family transcriptional regulator